MGEEKLGGGFSFGYATLPVSLLSFCCNVTEMTPFWFPGRAAAAAALAAVIFAAGTEDFGGAIGLAAAATEDGTGVDAAGAAGLGVDDGTDHQQTNKAVRHSISQSLPSINCSIHCISERKVHSRTRCAEEVV